MSACEQPCPSDSTLMIAWEKYKATDEYKNSLSWATRCIPDDDPAEIERVRASGSNPVTKANKEKYVEGSLWAAFMSGFLAMYPNGDQRPSDRTADVTALADAMWQLLDDMGANGQSVCLAAKAQARIAYEAFREDEKTCLWTGNGFMMPPPKPAPWLGPPDDRIHNATPGEDRANFRSASPLGFFRAAFHSNYRQFAEAAE